MHFSINAAVIAILALGCAMRPAWAQTPVQSRCEFRKVVDLPVDMSHGAPRVKIEASGETRRLALDTAQYNSALRPADLKALGAVSPHDASPIVVTDSRHAKRAVKRFRLQNFLIGGVLRLDGWDLIELHGQPLDSDLAGVIGIDLLSGFDVEFDLAHDRVSLFSSRNCGASKLVDWATGEVAQARPLDPLATEGFDAPVSLNGQPTTATLDTLSMASAVDADFAKTLGVQAGGYARFESFAIGGETTEAPTLAVRPLPRIVENIIQFVGPPPVKGVPKHIDVAPGLLLGVDFLRSHRVLVARSQRRIYIARVDGPVFAAAPR